MSFDDRKRRVQEIADSVPRRVQKSHQQWESDSDPPPQDETWPPVPVPGAASPGYRQRSTSMAGLQTGAAHIKHAIENMSKRVAALVALVGLLLTPANVGYAYWMANKGYITLDKYAKDEAARTAELNAKVREIEGQKLTLDAHDVRITVVERMVPVLQQQPIQVEKKRK